MSSPIPGHPITFPFHAKYSTALGGGLHQGVDYAAPVGTPVFACANGLVVGRNAPWGLAFGVDSVLIRHTVEGAPVFAIYAHLSHCDVPVGAKVVMGQRIGLSGAEGHVTGPHLHLEVQVGRWWKQDSGVDPLPLIKSQPPKPVPVPIPVPPPVPVPPVPPVLLPNPASPDTGVGGTHHDSFTPKITGN
jgi:murein DD-endopeptidase MepM/ murein hydrolase activator NlpD